MSNETQLAKVTLPDLKQLPMVAESNRELADKIKTATEQLLATIKGLPTDEQYQKLSKYSATAKDRLKQMQSDRMPMTRKLDEVKKVFTGIEAEVQDVISKIEHHERAYKAEVARRQAEAEEAQRKAREERERKEQEERNRIASAKAAIDEHYNNEFQRWESLTTEKQVESFRLARFEVDSEFLEYETAQWVAFDKQIEISRKARIKAIKDGKDQKAALERQRKQLEMEREAKALEEAEKEKAKSIGSLFDDEQPQLAVPDVKIKKELQVEIQTPNAMLLAVAKWFADKGKQQDMDALRKKFSFAITHLNQIANRDGEMLKDSDIKYKEVVR